jgi:beta-propeller repeat-containing protein
MMKRSATLVRRLFLLMLVLAGLANTLLPHGVAAGAALSLVNSNYNLIPFCLSGSTVPPSDLGRTFKESSARVNEAFGNLPLGFEANRGHAYDKVKFISRGNGYSLLLSCTDATLMLKAMPRSHWGFGDKTIDGQSQVGDVQVAAVRMSLVGSKTPGRLLGLDELPGKSNYFIGDDKCKWLANVPNYSKVKYEQVYPGIDLIYYGNQRQLEYDFHVAPGANPAAIRISFEGAKNIRVDNGGDLAIETAGGNLRQHRPVVFQVENGIKRVVAARYAVKSERVIGFELGEYDSSLPLTIDPVLIYSTYLGGSEGDQANAIAVDADGNAYVTGSTLSARFPVSQPLQRDLSGYFDVFVAKLNPSGNALLYSTYLGGSGDDQGTSIAVDTSGSAYVTGKTGGTFPTTSNAFQTDKPGGYDAFVTKLSPAGDALVYSTYLGGQIPVAPFFNPNTGTDIGYGIAVDREGSVYVTGLSYSPGFPIKKALQPVINGGGGTVIDPSAISIPPPAPPIFSDAFVSKLNPSATALVYSTFVGGFRDDEGRGIAVDSSGSVYVAGITDSTNFLTARAIQPAYGGDPGDAFLVKLEPSGRNFVFSTFLGGATDDKAYGVAVDAAGNAYITGETSSINFPTTSNAFQTRMGGSPIFKSTDGGSTWNAASAGLPDNSFNAFAIDPKTPATLYAGMGDLYGPGGAFKSTDGGGHWFAINNGLFASQKSRVSFLAIDPKTPSTLYALSLGAIFKTTDSGNSWNFAATTMPVFNPLSLAVDPANPTTLYAGSNACPPPPSPPLARSGLSTGSFDARASAENSASPVHPEEFFPRAVNKSTDGGVTWGPTAFPPCAVSSFAIDPKSSTTIYTTAFGIIVKSTDGGNTWRNTLNRVIIYLTNHARQGMMSLPCNAFASWRAVSIQSKMAKRF